MALALMVCMGPERTSLLRLCGVNGRVELELAKPKKACETSRLGEE